MMSRSSPKPRPSGWTLPRGLLLALVMAAPAWAQRDAEPLSRYVPSDQLIFLLENNGLEAWPDAWKATAAYKMLNETTLGAMLEDITAQLADRGLQAMPGAPATGKDVVALLNHLLNKGFVIGYCGTFNPPLPKAFSLVVRDAGTNEVFKRVLSKIPPINEPIAKQVELPGGRKGWTIEGSPVHWWYEKDDFVLSFCTPGAVDPVVNVLEGKAANAVQHPTRAALMKGGPGQVPVGCLFVDLSGMPPLPPQAVQLGLDGIKGIEASLGFEGEATITMVGVKAPRPRRGLLAMFDQPQIGADTKFAAPEDVTDFTLLSVDPTKLGDAVLALMKQNDLKSVEVVNQFARKFREQTGLSLRDDIFGKIGPRMAFVGVEGSGISNILGMWLHPPDFGLVAELKDANGFATTLDRLMEAANRELKAAGAFAPALPGQPAKPGTEFAEFRRLKPPERGYVLSVPPSVLPTPATFRPTILVDVENGVVAFAGKPATARWLADDLVLNGDDGEAIVGRDVVLFNQSDPSGSLPEMLASLPSIIQFIGIAATQPNGPGRPQPVGGPPFRLAIDPDAIPDVEAMRDFLFPTKSTLIVNDESIRFTGYQAFPIPIPQLNVGMEAPVLIALLLPAVQSAREAARRAQCTNNLKQIGLAMHNHHDVQDGFPALAIVDKTGKPLLSWRVAILPYIEQQALYNKFKLDEPWDSPNNKELLQYMPQTYACPSLLPASGPGMTTYRAFSGKGTLLEPDRLTRMNEVLDGTSNTLMVVESTDAVPWTKPDDIPFDDAPQARVLGPGSSHPGGFNALMTDGALRFIKSSVSPQVLRALVTKAGGEVISSDSY